MSQLLPRLVLTEQDRTKLASRGYEIQDFVLILVMHGGFGQHVSLASINERAIMVKQVFRSIDISAQNEFMIGELVDDIKRVRHPHQMRIYDVFLQRESELIFMEKMDNGDLKRHLDKLARPNWLSEQHAIQYYRQFGDALVHVHNLDIAHRAVQPDNIYMHHDYQVCKLGPFGMTTIDYDRNGDANLLLQPFRTIGYLPPEDYRIDGRNPQHSPLAGDVWRAGISLYKMLNGGGAHPFGDIGQNRAQLLQKINARDVQYTNASLSQSARRVIALHLKPNPLVRPTMQTMGAQTFRNKVQQGGHSMY